MKKKNIELIIRIIEEITKRFQEIKSIEDTKKFSPFQFPERLKQFTGVVFNRKCLDHIKLSNGLCRDLKRIEMMENSDRLSCLINEDDGIILNYKIFG